MPRCAQVAATIVVPDTTSTPGVSTFETRFRFTQWEIELAEAIGPQYRFDQGVANHADSAADGTR
jgi:hypothetical protein